MEVCYIMTLLGYGEEIRRRRVENFRECDMLTSAGFSPCTFITAGSKAEELACWNESDLDRLSLLNSVLCVEAGINVQTIPDDMQVYRMDARVYPDHCRMLRERYGSHARSFAFKNAMCDDGKGNALLSSGLLLDDVEQSLKNVLHSCMKIFHL